MPAAPRPGPGVAVSRDSFFTAMPNHAYFELHRLSDGLVYHFDRLPRPEGGIGYKRRDQDLWITYLPGLGWISYDEAHGLTGRPWTVLPHQQSEDHPPTGEWVSKKGVKSYVYELRYGEPPKT